MAGFGCCPLSSRTPDLIHAWRRAPGSRGSRGAARPTGVDALAGRLGRLFSVTQAAGVPERFAAARAPSMCAWVTRLAGVIMCARHRGSVTRSRSCWLQRHRSFRIARGPLFADGRGRKLVQRAWPEIELASGGPTVGQPVDGVYHCRWEPRAIAWAPRATITSRPQSRNHGSHRYACHACAR